MFQTNQYFEIYQLKVDVGILNSVNKSDIS